MDLRAHIQAARRAPLPGTPVPRREIVDDEIRSARGRRLGLSEALPLAVSAALALLWLVT